MSVTLDQVVPWGRSLDEYQRLFDLSETDLQGKILGCGDGPSSFNSEMFARGRIVTSIDPIYAFSRQQIAQRVEATYDTILSQVKQNRHNYTLAHFPDVDAVGRARLAAMDRFLTDFEQGLASGRYQVESLPALSFADAQFDLALCSHLLFLYSDQLSFEFHRDSIQELLRVAAEVRIFPLLGLDCRQSPHLEPICETFVDRGYRVEVAEVPYEFQKGGNRMLKISGHLSPSIGLFDNTR